MMDLLLLSTSVVYGGDYLGFAREAFRDFIGSTRTVHFAPYALADHAGYTERLRANLEPFGLSVVGLHEAASPTAAVEAAEVLYVGGGNTFWLLRAFQQLRLLDVVRGRVLSGDLRYWGSSAGSNLACPSIRTTNDMPIVETDGFGALGLLPCQINPHFIDAAPNSTHVGETREQRLTQFLEANDVPVVGLREGSFLRRQGQTLTLGGTTTATLFQRGQPATHYSPGSDLSHLLKMQPQFDC